MAGKLCKSWRKDKHPVIADSGLSRYSNISEPTRSFAAKILSLILKTSNRKRGLPPLARLWIFSLRFHTPYPILVSLRFFTALESSNASFKMTDCPTAFSMLGVQPHFSSSFDKLSTLCSCCWPSFRLLSFPFQLFARFLKFCQKFPLSHYRFLDFTL